MAARTSAEPNAVRVNADPRASPFYVPPVLDLFGGLVNGTRGFWLWLGGLESRTLAVELQHVPLRMPIFIAGLARSGSTLLHQIVASHPGVATHRSKDYPMLFTPYWWRRAIANQKPQPPRERVHRDGVLVNADSPEALEEMVWLAFFPRCHDAGVTCVLTARDRHPAFERFYRNHLRKLLLAEGATRYVAKANDHVARMEYLLQLFPDARFIIPVRNPVDHVASLLRQHRWFCAGQRRHPRSRRYMRRTGHFEFGLERRPFHLDDAEAVGRIVRAWAAGDDVRGLAITWATVYGYVARLLAANDRLRAATLAVRYEALSDGGQTIRAVLRHVALPDADAVAQRQQAAIWQPTVAAHPLSPADLAVIRAETDSVARQWRY